METVMCLVKCTVDAQVNSSQAKGTSLRLTKSAFVL
jgi:hypothetical protein